MPVRNGRSGENFTSSIVAPSRGRARDVPEREVATLLYGYLCAIRPEEQASGSRSTRGHFGMNASTGSRPAGRLPGNRHLPGVFLRDADGKG